MWHQWWLTAGVYFGEHLVFWWQPGILVGTWHFFQWASNILDGTGTFSLVGTWCFGGHLA